MNINDIINAWVENTIGCVPSKYYFSNITNITNITSIIKILQILCNKSVPGQNIRLAVCAVCAKQTMLFPLGGGHSQYAHKSYFANIVNSKNIANDTK